MGQGVVGEANGDDNAVTLPSICCPAANAWGRRVGPVSLASSSRRS
jgi:hypothetical protein